MPASMARGPGSRSLPCWWSGDAHIHIARGDVGHEAALSVARAEDIHVATSLPRAISARNIRQARLRATWSGESGRLNLVSGPGDPRTGWRGHTVHLNIAERARDAESTVAYGSARW
jgi:hypothetical protein